MNPPTPDLASFGLNDRWRALFDEIDATDAVLGRVVRQDRGFVVAATQAGTVQVSVRTDKTGTPVVVGDWVVIEGDAVSSVLERTSLLARRDPEAELDQPLVANVDLVLVVSGADRPRKAGRMERTITQTFDAGATPIVVVTKADLLENVDEEIAAIRHSVPLVEVLAVSVRGDNNIAALIEKTINQTSVMIGESGAGKSTLLNRLVGEDVAQTGAVREFDRKGRHTTTRREMYVLPQGGVLIDTPGLRSFGISADLESVDSVFADIAELAHDCKFRDCAHDTEPGCAVRAAVDDGTLSPLRFASWQGLRHEIEALELRKTEAERRTTDRKFGKLVDEALRLKGKRS